MTEHSRGAAADWDPDEYTSEFCALAVPPNLGTSLHAVMKPLNVAAKGRASIGELIDEWRRSGPLAHEPTGIPELDELTGGGPVYGSRWYLAGAPDAGKTAFLVQLAHVLAERGVTVGLLAVDEDAGDVVTRFAQRVGFSRSQCELRDPLVLDDIARTLESLPLRLYDSSWTIEAAAADLFLLAKERAQRDPNGRVPRLVLGIDSVQTVRCEADANAEQDGRELAEVSAVSLRVRAIRSVASQYRLIALATSELGRAAYRSGDPSQQTATLAAGKWSGSIEYSARVLLGLRSVPNQPGLVEVEVAKNKHGPRDRRLYLRIDRGNQTFSSAQFAPPPLASQTRDGAARDRVQADAIVVAKLLARRPGLGVRELRSLVRAESGIGSERVDAAIASLGEAITRGTGLRGAKPMSLDMDRLSAPLRQAIEGAQ